MTILIIDYGSGNLHSAAKAFQKAGDERKLDVAVTSDPDQLAGASHIVLPGVGAFGDCMAGLQAVNGMIEALQEAVLKRETPFFGICVGMQMMLTRGLEHGEHAGLGWIEGDVVPITQDSGLRGRDLGNTPPNAESRMPIPLKIPHMGWNELVPSRPDHPVFRDLPAAPHAYFVHSFHAQCAGANDVLATVDYGHALSACIGRGTMLGTQFHPEKSQAVGLRLIGNFLDM